MINELLRSISRKHGAGNTLAPGAYRNHLYPILFPWNQAGKCKFTYCGTVVEPFHFRCQFRIGFADQEEVGWSRFFRFYPGFQNSGTDAGFQENRSGVSDRAWTRSLCGRITGAAQHRGISIGNTHNSEANTFQCLHQYQPALVLFGNTFKGSAFGIFQCFCESSRCSRQFRNVEVRKKNIVGQAGYNKCCEYSKAGI